jgi:hypothetical protein
MSPKLHGTPRWVDYDLENRSLWSNWSSCRRSTIALTGKLVTFGVRKGKVGWSAHRLIKSDARRTWNCAVAVARNFRIRIRLLAGTNAASRAYLATI